MCNPAQLEHDNEGAYIEEEAFVPQHSFVLIPHNANQTANDRATTMILDMKNQDRHIQLQHDPMTERMQRCWMDANEDEDNNGME